MDQVYQKAFHMATQYMEQANDAPIQVNDTARNNLKNLDFDLQQDSVDPSQVIDELHQWVSPATMKMGSPRFFGFVIGGAYPVSVAANWLGTAWIKTLGSRKPRRQWPN